MKHCVSEFNVEVNDVITPLSCSAMVVEFIKYIIYQKELIPYPYERLKMFVDKRENQVENSQVKGIKSVINKENSKYALASNKYFKKTKEAHDSLENIFKVITEELTSVSSDHVEEIVLMLGTSFLNPQEVFRLCIPCLSYSHSVKFHPTMKNCRTLYKTMFKSEQFHNLISNSNCTSSLYIMLKMKPLSLIRSEYFIPRVGYNLPNRGSHAVISFNSLTASNCSCSDFDVFEDESDSSFKAINVSKNDSGLDQNYGWYQLRDTLKHFSDVRFNGVAITDFWMNPLLLDDRN